VDGKVDEPIAGAAEDVLGDEAGGEHPVPALARDVVDATLSKDKVAS